MTGFAIVSTTVGSEDDARALAHALVDGHFAACVQILPIASIYRWAGKVEDAREHLLLCKCREHDFAAIEAAIRAQHTYDIPEIIMTPVSAGHAGYLEWIGASTERT